MQGTERQAQVKQNKPHMSEDLVLVDRECFDSISGSETTKTQNNLNNKTGVSLNVNENTTDIGSGNLAENNPNKSKEIPIKLNPGKKKKDKKKGVTIPSQNNPQENSKDNSKILNVSEKIHDDDEYIVASKDGNNEEYLSLVGAENTERFKTTSQANTTLEGNVDTQQEQSQKQPGSITEKQNKKLTHQQRLENHLKLQKQELNKAKLQNNQSKDCNSNSKSSATNVITKKGSFDYSKAENDSKLAQGAHISKEGNQTHSTNQVDTPILPSVTCKITGKEFDPRGVLATRKKEIDDVSDKRVWGQDPALESHQ